VTPGAPRWHTHRYNRAAFYRLAGAVGHLPRRARLRVAAAAACLVARAMPAERAAVERNLRQITGADARALPGLIRALFRDFAMCFADLVSTNRKPVTRLAGYLSHVDGADMLDRADAGFISLTAHLGNWELGGRLLAGRVARPTHVVVSGEEARELEAWVRRDGDGMRFLPRSRATATLALVPALRRGEVVALQGDRALGGRGDTLVAFFGRPAPFPLGPFVLARAAGVPVVPAFCLLGADLRYEITLHEPFTVKTGGEETALRHWVAILERQVRRAPTQWFNFYDVWSPPGA
jgi:lauroyl/myristoyl acyltransferase